MKKIYNIFGIIFLALLFTFTLTSFTLKINAQENNEIPNMILNSEECFIKDENGTLIKTPCIYQTDPVDEIICPAVCVPMWISENNTCRFLECGSGCGVNNKSTFENELQCRESLKGNYQENRNNIDIPVPVLKDRTGLQVRFTPLIDAQTNSGYIYDFSKIHIRIVSTQEINISELVLKARMTEIQNNVDTIKEVNLIITELNAPQIIETASNENKSVEEKINQARNQVKENNGVGPSIISNRKVFVYNYMVSFSDNINQIASVYGKDYKSKAYNIDITLQNKRDQTIIDSQRHEVKYGLENIKEKIEEIKIHQDQVKILREEVKAEVSQAIEKARGESVLVRPLNDSEIFSNEDLTEMYVSNNLGIRKIRPINDVLISNKIKPEYVIGNVELISVNENVEYLVKIKEKRKLLGFIPFGNREKYLSLNASEDIEITE